MIHLTASSREEDLMRFSILRDEDGAYVGGITVWKAIRREGYFCYGIAIAGNMRRRGYALMAIRQLADLYFHEKGFNCCYAHVWEDNLPSRGLHEKLGFLPTTYAYDEIQNRWKIIYKLQKEPGDARMLIDEKPLDLSKLKRPGT